MTLLYMFELLSIHIVDSVENVLFLVKWRGFIIKLLSLIFGVLWTEKDRSAVKEV